MTPRVRRCRHRIRIPASGYSGMAAAGVPSAPQATAEQFRTASRPAPPPGFTGVRHHAAPVHGWLRQWGGTGNGCPSFCVPVPVRTAGAGQYPGTRGETDHGEPAKTGPGASPHAGGRSGKFPEDDNQRRTIRQHPAPHYPARRRGVPSEHHQQGQADSHKVSSPANAPAMPARRLRTPSQLPFSAILKTHPDLPASSCPRHAGFLP